jgi:hypothetical protein
MKTVHSFADIPRTPEMAEQQICLSLLRWALEPNYRAVQSRSGQIVHRRFFGHTLAELEAKVNALGPMAQRVKALPSYRAAVTYLCPDEHRPGIPVAA